MLGIFMGLATLSLGAVKGVENCIYEYDGYKRGLERKANGTDNTNSYFDFQGKRRDLKTRREISVDYKITEELYGYDRCIRDVKTGKVICNLSQEERDRKMEKARAAGKSVYIWNKYGNGYHFADGYAHRFGGDGLCEGIQVKDFKTGDVYVLRHLGFYYINEQGEKRRRHCDYYMKLNGMLVRPTDSQMREFKKPNKYTVPLKAAMEFVEEFNEGQRNGGYVKDGIYTDGLDNWKKEMTTKHPWWKHNMDIYYCNKNKIYTVDDSEGDWYVK